MRILAVMAALIFMSGCGGDSGSNDESGGESALSGKQSGEVIAVVEGEEITEGLLAERVEEMKKSMGTRMNPAEMAQMEGSFRNQAFSNLVNFKLLVNEADERGVTVTDSELQARTDQIIETYQSEEQFDSRLTELGMDREKFNSRLASQMKIDKLLEMETSSMEAPSGEEVKEYYDSHSAQFEQPEQVKASHILMKLEEDADQETRKQKREKLEAILQDIRNGASFSEQASLYSEGPSKSKGGDLGFFRRADMVAPFSEAAFALEVGEVSDIVETRYGYHIIKVTDRKKAHTVPFAEVEERISGYLENTDRNEAINDYLTSLREKAEIQYNDSTLVLEDQPE
jgi:peptidyl-prolyl cis-trans isomerase C